MGPEAAVTKQYLILIIFCWRMVTQKAPSQEIGMEEKTTDG